jgi:hypothetical protein
MTKIGGDKSDLQKGYTPPKAPPKTATTTKK